MQNSKFVFTLYCVSFFLLLFSFFLTVFLLCTDFASGICPVERSIMSFSADFKPNFKPGYLDPSISQYVYHYGYTPDFLLETIGSQSSAKPSGLVSSALSSLSTDLLKYTPSDSLGKVMDDFVPTPLWFNSLDQKQLDLAIQHGVNPDDYFNYLESSPPPSYPIRVGDVRFPFSGSSSTSSSASSSASSSSSSGGSGSLPSAPIQTPYFFADLAKAYGMDATTAYQEALSNTSYTRAVADLQRAGLNPVLAVQGLGGANGVYSARQAGNGVSFGFSGSSSGKDSHYNWKTLSNIGTVGGAAIGLLLTHSLAGAVAGAALGNQVLGSIGNLADSK